MRLHGERLEDRLTPAGELDPTFGAGGLATLPDSNVDGLVALPGGGAVTFGGNVLQHVLPDGTFDTTYGTNGKVTLAGDVFIRNAIALPDGHVVAAGLENRFSPVTLTVVKLTTAGQPDPSFGSGGTTIITFTAGQEQLNGLIEMTAQPDGSILFAGSMNGTPGATSPLLSESKMVALRLTPTGSMDTTFDSDGIVTVSFPVGVFNNSGARAVTVQPDGDIVLGGWVTSDSVEERSSKTGKFFHVPHNDLGAVRLTPTGELDQTFGTGGRVRIPLEFGPSENSTALAVGVLSDGHIVLAGVGNNRPGTLKLNENVGVRLTASGSLDAAYGIGGIAFLPDGFGGDHAVVTPDGRAVFSRREFVARLSADGRPDLTFLAPGVPTNTFVTHSTPEPVYDHFLGTGLSVQADGNILVGGYESWSYDPTFPGTSESIGIIARILSDGAPTGFLPAAQVLFLVSDSTDGLIRPITPSGSTVDFDGTMQYVPVRTITADMTGDGVPDYVWGTGPDRLSNVTVFDGKTGITVSDFLAFEPSFTGGVFVAAGDLDADGKVEIVVTPDQGGGPVVAVYSGAKLAAGLTGEAAQLARFFGIEDPAFRGGARPALGEVNGDGTPDLLVSAGFLGGPRIALFDGTTVAKTTPTRLIGDFFAFEDTLRNGAFVTAGDVNGDGNADLAFGGGPGGAPRVRLFDGATLLAAPPFTNLDAVAATGQLANFFAGDSSRRGGIRLTMADANADGIADLITGSGENERSQIRVYTSDNLLANTIPLADQILDPFGATISGGVYVG